MPELKLVHDAALREKVVEAWTLSCSMGGYKRLEDVPTECFEQMPNTSNIDHQKGTTQIAVAMARCLKGLGVKLNEDYVAAGALCHDVGKPIEWRNGQRGVYSTATGAGTFYGENHNMPSFEKDSSFQIARHPVWGFYVAVQVGMPDHVVHIIAAHSLEGQFLFRSKEALIVKEADEIWWEQVGYQISGKWPDVESPLQKGKIYRYRKLNWRRKPEQ
jgi:putative nucleotidyltransferase with HDIG domain